MRFLLVDRILSYTPWKDGRGFKFASSTEQFWRSTPNGLIMPPSLVIEMLLQTGTWLLYFSSDRCLRGILVSIESIQFGRHVRPGDALIADVTIDSRSDDVIVMSGTVAIGGDAAVEAAGILCTVVAADQLDDPVHLARMASWLIRADEK